jgi:hypothetical protein
MLRGVCQNSNVGNDRMTRDVLECWQAKRDND